jgi:hypothetical protein
MALVARHQVAMPLDAPLAIPAETAPAIEPSLTLNPPTRQALMCRGHRLEK